MTPKKDLELIATTVKQFNQNEMMAIKGGNVDDEEIDDGGGDDGGDDSESSPGKRLKRCLRRIPPTE
jgi:hypothetical protein